MPSTDIRKKAQRLVAKLPAHSTWDDLMHEIYVRQAIESGRADRRQGRLTKLADVRKRYRLAK